MSLQGIISISGRPGIFKVVAQGKNNVIVESLLDKKRFPAYASERISSLEDISIFTLDGDVKLSEVFEKMLDHYKGAKGPGHKDNYENLCSDLEIFVPDYDRDRVYPSDIKKLFQWYNILIDQEILKVEEKKKETSSIEVEGEKPKKAAKKTSESKTTAKTKGASTTKSSTKSTKASSAKKVATPKTGASRGK